MQVDELGNVWSSRLVDLAAELLRDGTRLLVELEKLSIKSHCLQEMLGD